MTRLRESIPRRVVLAMLAQTALAAADVGAIAVFGLGLVGIRESPSPADSAGLVVIGFIGIAGALGVMTGTVAIAGMWNATTWARFAGLAHVVVSISTCCPCGWFFAILALVITLHPDVASWPERARTPEGGLADVFR